MYLCIDIGGTKTLVALITSRGIIKKQARFLSNPNQSQFFKGLFFIIKKDFPLDGIEVISVAIPGPVEHNRPTWFANLPWSDLDFESKLRTLAPVPIFFENDANLAGLAEAKNRPGTTIYLTFSTGVGGAIIKNGQIDPKNPNFEPGHTIYSFNGQPTEWEDFASAKAIRAHFGDQTTHSLKNSSDWQEIARRIAIGLSPILRTHHPDLLILGGPIGLELKKYKRYLKALMSEAGTPLPRTIRARHGHESVIKGNYLYAKHKLSH